MRPKISLRREDKRQLYRKLTRQLVASSAHSLLPGMLTGKHLGYLFIDVHTHVKISLSKLANIQNIS